MPVYTIFFKTTEALKVNKFGQTYCTGTQAAQAIVEELLFFNFYVNVQLGFKSLCECSAWFLILM